MHKGAVVFLVLVAALLLSTHYWPAARLALFKRSGLGDHYMADLDGVMIAVSQRNQ